MSDLLLFVCSQNICRSPYLEWSMRASSTLQDRDALLIASRGATATRGRGMCAVATSHLSGPIRVLAQDHRSRQLTASDLERSDLVLTTSTQERSAAALLHPAVRSRLFTVREAILLGESLSDSVPKRTPSSSTSQLRILAEQLNARRGIINLRPQSEGRGFRRRRSSESSVIDISDRHTGSPARHRKMFSELDVDVAKLARLITTTLDDGDQMRDQPTFAE